MGYIISGIIFLVLLFFIFAYNRIVKLKNLVKEAWSAIDVQLKRRYNLIPNLLETVKSYTNFEKNVMENTVKLRNNAESAETVKEQNNAEMELSKQVKTLLAVVENYPDLKANETYIKLMESLTDIENTIQYARRYYNGAVRNYNTLIQSFPTMIIADLFKYKDRDYFEIELIIERQVPKVK